MCGSLRSEWDFFSQFHVRRTLCSPRADWAPLGAARFTQLSKAGFFEDCRFFRVLKGFVAQFGINGDPAVQAKYRGAVMQDDPVTQSNKRGTVVFATSGKNSRTTQVGGAAPLHAVWCCS